MQEPTAHTSGQDVEAVLSGQAVVVVPPPVDGERALTPMMKQYLEAKAQVGDAILFFRLGDFYEMFFDDAVRASELLHITLTARSKSEEKVPMCGVPHHAARRYIARLIEMGLKVAICEQVEEAGGPGIVRREVVRVVTPGTVLDDEVLEATDNNFLAAVLPSDEGPWGAALLDGSTGEFFALAPGDADALGEELRRFGPREMLVPEGAQEQLEPLFRAFERRPALATLERDAFERSRAEAFLKAHFQVASLEGFGLDPASASVGAAGAALRYLKQTQKSSGQHVDRLSVSQRGKVLVIDEASRANLELFATLKDQQRKGSLLGALDMTSTSLGARKLKRWLLAPLCDCEVLGARLDAVEELFKKAVFRDQLVTLLKEVADIERLLAKLSLGTGTPRDMGALGRSLVALGPLVEALKAGRSPLLRALVGSLEAPQVLELGTLLKSALVDEPAAVVADGGFIRDGFDLELDEVVKLSTQGKDFLAKLEAEERQRTGIGSLKVRYNRVFGYYLEVTKANLHLVPKDYVRKQTMVGAERFTTDALKLYEEKVLTAEERRLVIEVRLFSELRLKVLAHASALKATAEALATTDVLACFAKVAAVRGYSRPVLDTSTVLEIVGGRHPVVEQMLEGEGFVPNDVRLDRETQQLLIITGPNMAGKSTVMRQTALIVLMAQAGSFVPAQSARIGLVDRVFTRVGAADNLAKGHSTFMVEMTETANILHHATKKSLVILDEIGRGTSTFDGLSIAWAVAEHLVDRIGARSLFATHYHELTDLSRERPKVKNASIAVKESNGRVTFLRKLVPVAASKSYGLEVARLAGLPPEVLARAQELLKNLEAGELDESGRPRLARQATALRAPVVAEAALSTAGQLGLFVPEPEVPLAPVAVTPPAFGEVLEALKGFNLEGSTPLEALNAIAGWKRSLRDG